MWRMREGDRKDNKSWGRRELILPKVILYFQLTVNIDVVASPTSCYLWLLGVIDVAQGLACPPSQTYSLL